MQLLALVRFGQGMKLPARSFEQGRQVDIRGWAYIKTVRENTGRPNACQMLRRVTAPRRVAPLVQVTRYGYPGG